MSSSLDRGDERRRFFRINDAIGVAYRRLSPEELDQGVVTVERGVSSDPQVLLKTLDKTIQTLLPLVGVKQPEMAQLLGAMDQKLNYLVGQLEVESRLVERIAHRVHEVNISACGMALVIDEPIALGSVLALDLLLRPSEVHIHTHGVVVACQLAERDQAEAMQGTHYVRMEFRGMGVADQELLIQHIVQRQSLLIRADKDSV